MLSLSESIISVSVTVFLSVVISTVYNNRQTQLTFEALTSRVNSLSVALRAGYLSVRTAEGASEKQSSLKARLRNGLTYLLTYLIRREKKNIAYNTFLVIVAHTVMRNTFFM